jgi:hypothetical protein
MQTPIDSMMGMCAIGLAVCGVCFVFAIVYMVLEDKLRIAEYEALEQERLTRDDNAHRENIAMHWQN